MGGGTPRSAGAGLHPPGDEPGQLESIVAIEFGADRVLTVQLVQLRQVGEKHQKLTLGGQVRESGSEEPRY